MSDASPKKADLVRDWVRAKPPGSVFRRTEAVSETGVGNSSVLRAFRQLLDSRELTYLEQGYYRIPKYSRWGWVPPDRTELAQAYARSKGYSVRIAGEVAANLYGLSNDVPATHVFDWDGPGRVLAKIAGRGFDLRPLTSETRMGWGRVEGDFFRAVVFAYPLLSEARFIRAFDAMPPSEQFYVQALLQSSDYRKPLPWIESYRIKQGG